MISLSKTILQHYHYLVIFVCNSMVLKILVKTKKPCLKIFRQGYIILINLYTREFIILLLQTLQDFLVDPHFYPTLQQYNMIIIAMVLL